MASIRASRHPASLPDSAAFWGVGGILGVFLFAASAPSPLYRVYAARWHFPPLTLTIVFALYALGLLLALLVTGRLSDHLGRRPVTLAAIAAEIIAMACFIAADSTVVLAVARAVQHLLWGGAAVFCLCFTAGAAVVLLREVTAQTAMLAGCSGLFTGVGLIVIAIAAGSTALFLAGSVVAGTGFGLAFLGNIRAILGVAAPAQRAETLAVLYIVSYTMFSIPIMVAGIAETHFSAHDVALVFSGCVTALAAIGTGASLAMLRAPRPRAVPSASALAGSSPAAGAASHPGGIGPCPLPDGRPSANKVRE